MLDCMDNKSFGGSSYFGSKSAAKDLNLISTNNNELISRSSKITQELELKLKERRQMMESKSDKFQPKIIHQNEISPNSTPKNKSNPDEVETKQQLEWQTQSEVVIGENHSCATKNLFISSSQITSTNQNCVCPCHAHGHANKHHHHHIHNHNKHASAKDLSSSSSNSTSSASSDKSDSSEPAPVKPHVFVNKCHHHSALNNKNKLTASSSTNKSESSISTSSKTDLMHKYKKPKIIIDGSSTLPTKRESIRMLIENKAVSENKQKDRLEMHLNTLLGSRASTLNLNNVSD